MTTLIRIRHETLGGHVHMRVFVGKGLPDIMTLGLAGNLVMRVYEFEDFRRMVEPVGVHFVEEHTTGAPTQQVK